MGGVYIYIWSLVGGVDGLQTIFYIKNIGQKNCRCIFWVTDFFK